MADVAPHPSHVDEDARPQIADLEDERSAAYPCDDPPGQAGQQVRGGGVDDVDASLGDPHEHSRHGVRQPVHDSADAVAPIGRGANRPERALGAVGAFSGQQAAVGPDQGVAPLVRQSVKEFGMPSPACMPGGDGEVVEHENPLGHVTRSAGRSGRRPGRAVARRRPRTPPRW